MAHSYEDWTAMPDDELVALYDHHAPNVFVGLDFITKELTRRQENRRMEYIEKLTEHSAEQVSKLARLTEEGATETKAMVALTETITRLTKVITALTIVTAIVSVAALLVTLVK